MVAGCLFFDGVLESLGIREAFSQFGFCQPNLLAQGVDFVIVTCAEHPAGAVVDLRTVVFFVAEIVSELAVSRHGPARFAQLGHRVHTLVVEAGRQFGLQPGKKPPRCDVNFRTQATRGKGRRDAPRQIGGKPDVDQPCLQVHRINGITDAGIVLLRHNKGAGKATKHAFRRRLPIGFAVTHGQQISHKRQLVFLDPYKFRYSTPRLQQTLVHGGPVGTHEIQLLLQARDRFLRGV